MEIVLSPSILSADFAELGKQVKEAAAAGAPWLHIDVMDGVFVPNISFGFPIIKSIRKLTDAVFDVHLMITEPERYIERFLDAGADILTFHAEATGRIDECIEMIKGRGRKAGLAISPNTPIDAVLPYLDRLDMALCMTVEPGYGGQKYMKSVEEKISALRNIAGRDFYIQIDGGVTTDNITEPVKAGANVIVAGSAVFKGSITDNIKELKAACARL
ncbi:MAG: ribulose-phosphate 3-epimerase [Candidatus Ornithomonoglobus sp.]